MLDTSRERILSEVPHDALVLDIGGWAKPFPSSGDVTRTITWPVGTPPPAIDVGSGDVERTPGLGREDRADERGSSR